jgi:glyoxylase-like metal-dependent hydrolase (beta-lactamase superfamily II)
MKLRAGIAAMGGVLFAASPIAAQDAANVQIHAEHVSGGVHMLTGSGGNIGVSAGSDGLLIVDDQFAPLADKIKASLAELSDSDVSFVLNTHWHPDHTGGNVVFGRAAPIVAHSNVRRILMSGAHVLGRDVPPAPPEALPVVTFGDSVSIHFNGEEIRVIHYPHGHTDGDAVVFFFGSNVVHMGDDFFAGRFPFVDLGNGGSVQGLADNVAAVLDRLASDTKVIPGHGPLSGKDDLHEYHEMLTESIALVSGAIERGESLEQVLAAGVPERWEAWGSGFISTEQWLTAVFTSLSQN